MNTGEAKENITPAYLDELALKAKSAVECSDDDVAFEILKEDLPLLLGEVRFLRKALGQAYALTGMTATDDGWVVDSHDKGNTKDAYPDLYEWCMERQRLNPVKIV